MLNQVRFEFNQRLLGLTPKEVEDMTSFAPLAVVKQVSKNFQSSIDGVEKQISMLKDFLKNLVSRNDLQAMMEKLNSIEIGNANETAGGRLGISCLLCGRPVQKVTGMITEGDVARLLGTPPGSIAGISRGSNKYVLVYGNEVMKNSKAKKKTQLPPIQKPPNGGPSPHEK
ncbi:hypothetical protein GPJ56_009154 [Histomonas meleagridis]|uniref:uncharacterized protein n=1 Tax=Histomonas meleagridis TaxID=135588 RepID=UPI0035593FE2|nr:hypothetical protein GPJ56_009154 [Histomonas meleagridis]KAH0799092.1 hypothetical protein GO595_007889 [Histomonas meleagridis]